MPGVQAAEAMGETAVPSTPSNSAHRKKSGRNRRMQWFLEGMLSQRVQLRARWTMDASVVERVTNGNVTLIPPVPARWRIAACRIARAR
ncbi:hypothetical protein Xcc1_42060 [Xanthomonas campestris pv. campestris]|nr:hypothetical protein Xcc1_42060 [Xanthomonas campestris pv. campestris]